MFECVHPFFIGLYDYIYICMHMCKHKHRDKCVIIMRKKDSCYLLGKMNVFGFCVFFPRF